MEFIVGTRLRPGSTFLYDDVSNDIVGVRDPDGSEFFWARAPKYGLFRDSSNQSATINTPTEIEFDSPMIEEGITVVDSTKLRFSRGGKFNFTLTAQINNSDSQIHNFWLWGRIDEEDIPDTLTRVSVPESHGGVAGAIVLERTYFAPIAAGQYVEVMWMTDNAGVTLKALSETSGPPAMPAGPSVSLSIYEVAL